MTAFVLAETPADTPPEPTALDPIAMALGEQLRDAIWTGSAQSPRSRQLTAGMSEIGGPCERQIGYKIAGRPTVNFDNDPLTSLVGTGLHAALAELFTRLDGGMGRYLIETPCTYRGIPGSADLYDRRRKLLLDWKSTAKGKLRQLRNDGPPLKYIVQVQLYAQALRLLGEDVQRVAIVYIPRDGSLNDLFVWSTGVDQALADQWVARYERIADRVVRDDGSPAGLEPTPTRLCGWCSHYRPGSTNPDVGCPGNSK